MQPTANRREWRARRWSHRAKRFCFAILGATLLLCTLTTQASLPNFRLCFRPALNVPGPNFGQPPVVDGTINNDFGWTDGWRYVFGNGTPVSDVVVQAIRTNTDLYMSFEVNNDLDFDDQDVIVLTLDPDGTAANQRRLHIFPVFTGTGAAGSGDPRDVEYWANSTTWNSTAAGAPPAGTLIKVTSSGVAPNVSYFVEIKLPRAAYGIPAVGDFGLYFNVLRVLGPNVNEKFWPTPPSTPPIGLFLTNTPPASTWGTANVAGTCNGVSITPADITTNQSPSSKIALTGPNTFFAVAHNNTIDSAGNPIAANQVNATFRIANFGLPSPTSWNLVPATGGTTNPTGSQNIPLSSNATFSMEWTLTGSQPTDYDTPTTRHQCILVELDSTAPNTVFVNKSAWTNMDFGPASTFERVAEVSGKGYGRPPGGAANHAFDILVTTRVDEVRPGNQTTSRLAAMQMSNQRVAQMTWLAHGYRHTGNYVEIMKKRYPIVDHVGSYGHLVFHPIPQGGDLRSVNWDFRLSGGGIKQQGRNKNMYRLDVPVDGAAVINTAIVATDKTTTPPKKRKCGEARSFTGGIVMLAGVFLTGFTLYRPRRKKGRA